ncbi:hypothetical protein GLOIN_2v1767044 [Rhizophagus irregularis DAOM 181602=DAOM 197198]|nr:hypothetical protein GLOIN_2v1767044 [Rhizophagus irregularis DAOM 181602=DAOM 197198]
MLSTQKTSSYGRSTFPSMKKTKNLSSINVNIKEELGGSPVETKEVHCTATYDRKSVIFQWTVTREMVSLEDFKKKLCEYLTFPDGTENEHIVIGRVVASSSSQSATIESDTVEITTERKVIQFSADEDLLRIIWTTNPKVDLEIVVDTSQQPFSSYTFFSLIAMINYHVLRLEVQQLQKRSGTV